MGLAGYPVIPTCGAMVAAASRCQSRHCCLLSMLKNMLMPQISHMLLGVFERCEPSTSRPASATLTAILQHPAWVCLTLSTGRPTCAPCIIVVARCCGAITTAQTTIFQHPAGVPLTLSAGCPIWAELIPIGACRRRWRRSRGTWRRRASACRWGRTGRVEDACASGTIGTRLVAPSRAILSTIPAICSESATSTAPWRRARGSPWGWRLRGMRQERTNRSNESALEGDPSVRSVRPQVFGCALLTTGTIPALHAQIGRWLVQRKRRIQPQHVDFHVIPERNRHDVAAVQRLAHGRRTPLFHIIVHVPESNLLGPAECIINVIRVVRSQDRRNGTHDHVAILDVVPLHLVEISVVRPIGCDELRHDCDRLQCVDFELRAAAEELPVAHPVWVDITTVLVADTIIPLALVIVATSGALTLEVPDDVTRMRSVRICHAVRLPDVHLCTARAVLALAHV